VPDNQGYMLLLQAWPWQLLLELALLLLLLLNAQQ
jgi:hypothetical protein